MNLTSNSYNIIIDKGSLSNLGKLIESELRVKKAAIITDSTIFEIYKDALIKGLESGKFEYDIFCIEPGENKKSLKTVEWLSNRLIDFGIDRNSLIIAFGGGVVGDLSGFIASCFMRGIRYVQVPTTLLAQIDSSVGGKTAVNLKKGKNLLGAFHQPTAVIIDPELLLTLDPRVLRDGIGEAIKYGCIQSTKLFELFEQADGISEVMADIEEIIYESCSIKARIVEKDEKDLGERQLLNFGHTLGHAIERYYDFNQYSHGEAVSIGMATITKNSEYLGITAQGAAERIINVLNKYDLPVNIMQDVNEKLIELTFNDKKSTGDNIQLVVLDEIGKAKIILVSKKDLHKYLTQ